MTVDEKVDMNNFHLYMPRGIYRRFESSQSIVTDLDVLMAETGFDLRAYKRLKRQVSEAREKATGQELKIAVDRWNAAIYPLYAAMLQKGYSRTELIR